NDFSALGSGHQAPLLEGALGGVHGGFNIGLAGLGEDADHVAMVGGIAIFKSLSGRGLDPLAVDEVLVNLGSGCSANHGGAGQGIGCHDVSLRMRTKAGALEGERGGGRGGKGGGGRRHLSSEQLIPAKKAA